MSRPLLVDVMSRIAEACGEVVLIPRLDWAIVKNGQAIAMVKTAIFLILFG